MHNNSLIRDIFLELAKAQNIKDAKETYDKLLSLHEDVLLDKVFVIGVNNNSCNFHTSKLCSFIDTNKGNKAYIVTPIPEYKNINVFSVSHFEILPIDATLLIDSNAVDYFYHYYIKHIELNDQEASKYSARANENLIESIYKYDVDINYLPYALEDFCNPFRENKNIDITKQKLKSLMFLANINRELFKKNGRLEIDQALLNNNGFKNFDDFYNDRIRYLEEVSICHKNLFSDYFFACGILLYIYTIGKEKIDSIKKLECILQKMHSLGRISTGIIQLASNYFNNKVEAIDFFKIKHSKTQDDIIKGFKNKAWDIFLFQTSARFAANPRSGALFGYPMFLTEDKKFFNGYLKYIGHVGIVIDKAKKIESPIVLGAHLEENEILMIENFYTEKKLLERTSIHKNNEKNMYVIMEEFYKEQSKQVCP